MNFADREKKRATGRGVVSAIAGRTESEEKTAGRPKVERETKKRISLAVLPSLYKQVQKIAYVERSNASEVTSALYEQYIKDNADKLNEYDKLKK